MSQTYTLEEAADKLNLSVEEFKRRLRTEWTQIRSFRDGATLRFRASEIDELARTIGAGSKTLDSVFSNLQARTDATEKIREAVSVLKRVVAATSEVISSDVEIAGGVASELRAIANSIQRESSKRGLAAGIAEAFAQAEVEMEVPSAFERICNYFWERDNEPATVGQIITATKSSAAAVRQLIYNRRRDQFVKVSGSGESVKYQLAELMSNPPRTEEAKKESAKPT